MAAGLGFKDFATGEVLTAADVDGYLMQGIWVFASNAARDAAVTAPAEGNFAFTKDTNSLWYYDGAAWVASGATGDIEGVTAGVGISGGGTSGTVTVTNSMATAITTAGDTLYGTGSGTFSRLGIGTAGQVLQVNSGATAPEWATAAGGGGMTVLASGSMPTGGTVLDLTSISGSYNNLQLVMRNLRFTGAYAMDIRVNNKTTGIYQRAIINGSGSTFSTQSANTDTGALTNYNTMTNGNEPTTIIVDLPDYTNTTAYKIINITTYAEDHDNTGVFSRLQNFSGVRTTEAIDRITTVNTASQVSAGTYTLYGIK
jgi:hypothetical protein